MTNTHDNTPRTQVDAILFSYRSIIDLVGLHTAQLVVDEKAMLKDVAALCKLMRTDDRARTYLDITRIFGSSVMVGDLRMEDLAVELAVQRDLPLKEVTQ